MYEEYSSNVDNLITKALKMGADEVELFVQELHNKSSFVESNKLKSASSSKSQGIGIRVLVKNAVGFVSINSLEKKTIEESIKKAIKIAELAPPQKNYFLPKKRKVTFVENLYDEAYENLTMKECIEYSEQILKECNSINSDIKIESGIFSAIKQKCSITTSTGIQLEEEKTGYLLEFAGMAVTEKEIGTWDEEYCCYTKIDEINIDSFVKNFTNKAIQNLGAKKTEGFLGRAILSPEATRALLRLIVESAQANNIQSNSSFLCDRLGANIADSKLSIIDDGTIPGLFSSRSFDREGVPTQKCTIIDKGMFTNILYNSFTAIKQGLNSTGHACGDYREIPFISSTNIEVLPGERTLEELIAETRKGILFNRISASPDFVSGDFAAVLKGAKIIENGKLENTLKEITALGNIYEMVKSIEGITREQKPLTYYQSWQVPYMAFDNVRFTT